MIVFSYCSPSRIRRNPGCPEVLETLHRFIRDRPINGLKLQRGVHHSQAEKDKNIVNDVAYYCDEVTNVSPRILSFLNRNLHNTPQHPLSLLKRRLITQINSQYPRKGHSPRFACLDTLSPVVTPYQNYDSLLVPLDHPSRRKSDAYYLNKDYLLRAHTSAHQMELLQSGLDHFIVVGDVYRRDEIDRTHFPVFHQMEGLSMLTSSELFSNVSEESKDLQIFEREPGLRSPEKQEYHTRDAAFLMGHHLKSCLTKLVQHLFGEDVQTRWVDTYFPFTHPSWELEINSNDKWIEMLGCGIVEHALLRNSGVENKIGWAFGIGLERLAMKLYGIPDIRLFWSKDTGFLSQFKTDDPFAQITYKAVSAYPQCINDISFWIRDKETFSKNDFFDIVRSIGGEMVEQVCLQDEFYHSKKKLWSHCYRITYRSTDKTLTQQEVNEVHKSIEKTTVDTLGVDIR